MVLACLNIDNVFRASLEALLPLVRRLHGVKDINRLTSPYMYLFSRDGSHLPVGLSPEEVTLAVNPASLAKGLF